MLVNMVFIAANMPSLCAQSLSSINVSTCLVSVWDVQLDRSSVSLELILKSTPVANYNTLPA